MGELEQEVAELQRDLEELRRFVGLAPRRHSAELLDWAERLGIDPDDFEPMELPPVGTHTLTVAEAAQMLTLSEEHTRRLLRSGALFGVPLGGRAGWRVSRSAVEELLRQRGYAPTSRRPRGGL